MFSAHIISFSFRLNCGCLWFYHIGAVVTCKLLIEWLFRFIFLLDFFHVVMGSRLIAADKIFTFFFFNIHATNEYVADQHIFYDIWEHLMNFDKTTTSLPWFLPKKCFLSRTRRKSNTLLNMKKLVCRMYAIKDMGNRHTVSHVSHLWFLSEILGYIFFSFSKTTLSDNFHNENFLKQYKFIDISSAKETYIDFSHTYYKCSCKYYTLLKWQLIVFALFIY